MWRMISFNETSTAVRRPQLAYQSLLALLCLLANDYQMTCDDEFTKLLSQSKEAYSKYLDRNEVEDLAEAGEFLWECLKFKIAQLNNMKTANISALREASAQMGEVFNQLFFHCYHFHSWYLMGVLNDLETEKKLYLESVRTLENIINNKENSRKTKKKIEKSTEQM